MTENLAKIVVNTHTRHGQPRIAGTRITVPDVLYRLADSGGDIASLMVSLPCLREDHILASIRWAAEEIEKSFQHGCGGVDGDTRGKRPVDRDSRISES